MKDVKRYLQRVGISLYMREYTLVRSPIAVNTVITNSIQEETVEIMKDAI